MEEPARPSLLDRFLMLFTAVEPGEGRTALLMFINVFLILFAYYLVKPLREGWISVSDVGSLTSMQVKAYSSFGQSLLLIPIVLWFGRMSERLPRSTLITRSTLFCMSNMLFFWAAQPDFFIANLPWIGILFYLWVGMFGVFIVAQFWAFAADVYPEERGDRMMPVVAIGATAGAAFGGTITDWLVGHGVLSTEWLLFVAMAPLAVGIWLTRWVSDREQTSAEPAPAKPATPEAPQEPENPSGVSPLRVVLSSRFLLATAVITLILNWVNTNGENLLFEYVQMLLADQASAQGVEGKEAVLRFTRDGTTAFYGDFYSWVNIVALGLQALVAARLLRYGGFGAALLLLPVVALTSYTAMALVPVLGLIKIMKIAENATDYSINNTARHVLWLPLDADTKYKGKTTIDSMFVRLGDGLAAATVLVCIQILALPIASFFVINIALVLVWLAFSIVVVREHRKLSEVAGEDAS